MQGGVRWSVVREVECVGSPRCNEAGSSARRAPHDLPHGRRGVVFSLLSAALGTMTAMSRKRFGVGKIVLWSFVATSVANECVTRGYVTDAEGQPVPGADVWLADSTHVVHRLRTDADGYYWVLHAPFARYRYALLLCEGKDRMFVDHSPVSALFWTGYGVDVYKSRFPDVPADRGWIAAVPPSCPIKHLPSTG